MLAYLHDAAATILSAPEGCFHTVDLGGRQPADYIELRDGSKDIIISGGENISSVEVEQVIMDHRAVLEVAVVATPDERWGEVPTAYVTLVVGATATATAHVRTRLVRFKGPLHVHLGVLPKTSKGKVHKVSVRETSRARLDGNR